MLEPGECNLRYIFGKLYLLFFSSVNFRRLFFLVVLGLGVCITALITFDRPLEQSNGFNQKEAELNSD
jgi:hypothetical protein